MSRPRPLTATSIPPSALVTAAASRRNFLRGAALGGALLASPTLLAACGSDSSGGTASKTVSFGMNEAGDIPPAARLRNMAAAYAKKSGIKVKTNQVEHNTFQENINTYLQGNPDDVFTWFAGFRMDQFATQGLIDDVSDVWPIDGMADSFKKASTASDGKQYLVPKDYYPWAVFYRKSVFAKKGYEVPTTLDELTALSKKMSADGIAPFAFGDKDGWPAMGTFDILNMRINGFKYHMDLMAGKAAWDSSETKQVFDTWASLLPYHQPDALGRTWQEAATSMGKGQAGMYLLGTFVADAIPDAAANLDFFTFPELDSSIGATALDAPIDGFCLSAGSKNKDAGKAFLKYLGTAEAEDAGNTGVKVPFISANSKAKTDAYSALQKKSAEVVGAATDIAQFLDRDTRADFASTVVIPSIQSFLKNPKDIDGITKKMEEQKKSIFAA